MPYQHLKKVDENHFVLETDLKVLRVFLAKPKVRMLENVLMVDNCGFVIIY